MASINFMGPNSLPLISAAAVTAALAQRPAAAVEGPAALTPASHSASQIIEAKVESVSAKAPGYEVTVSSGKQSLVVKSDIPLPVGTRLTLQVPITAADQTSTTSASATSSQPVTQAPAQTSSQVPAQSSNVSPNQAPTLPANQQSTQAPAMPATPVPQGTASTSSAAPSTNTAAQNTNTPSVATPVPAQSAPVKTDASAPALTIKVLSIVLPAAADSSPKTSGLLQQFMAARVPLLTTQQAPVAADSSTYQKPGLSQYLAAATPQAAAPSTLKMATPVLTLLNQLAPASIGKDFATSVTNPAAGNNAAPLNSSSATTALNSAAISSAANAVNKLPAAKMPTEVAAILQKWQQQLPTSSDLSQPSGLSQAIKNSGIQYESQVFKTLETMLAKQNNVPLNESAPAQLFKSLWQKAAQLTEAVKNPPTFNNAAELKTDNLASTTNPAANISQVLQAVKAKLEAPLTAANAESSAAAPSSTATPSLLSALLGSDHKAVISRALITWSRLIQKMDSAPLPVRSLPMTPQQDVPETFRLLQSALAQTETEQAQRLNQADNWQLNIPLFYRDGDMTREVRMHLNKEEQNSSAEAGKKTVRWRLRLHFDLQQLGPLDVDLELQWPALSATFWSEQQQALGLLNKELQPLRKTLTDMGVMVEELQARHGKLPEPSRNVISSRLIDTHS